MFKSKDPLVESARQAMEKGIRDRAIESVINEAFGVESRKALPNEFHSDYDALLSEAKSCGKIDEALKDKIHKVAKSLYNELPKRKEKIEKATERAMQGKTPKDWARRQAAVNSVVKEEELEEGSPLRKLTKDYDDASKKKRISRAFDKLKEKDKEKSEKNIKEEEQLDEISKKLASNYIKTSMDDVREDKEIEGLIDHLVNEGFSYDEIDSGINDGVFDDFLSEGLGTNIYNRLSGNRRDVKELLQYKSNVHDHMKNAYVKRSEKSSNASFKEPIGSSKHLNYKQDALDSGEKAYRHRIVSDSLKRKANNLSKTKNYFKGK